MKLYEASNESARIHNLKDEKQMIAFTSVRMVLWQKYNFKPKCINYKKKKDNKNQEVIQNAINGRYWAKETEDCLSEEES